jgi:hypothetical protein
MVSATHMPVRLAASITGAPSEAIPLAALRAWEAFTVAVDSTVAAAFMAGVEAMAAADIGNRSL